MRPIVENTPESPNPREELQAVFDKWKSGESIAIPARYSFRIPREIPSDAEILHAAAVLVQACHGRAWNAGWWHDPATGKPLERNRAELICLMHSELSEAMEGVRKDSMDDKLTHRKMAPVELADAAIRIFDMIGACYPDDVPALVEKLNYNANRADHKPENRILPGGKKF